MPRDTMCRLKVTGHVTFPRAFRRASKGCGKPCLDISAFRKYYKKRGIKGDAPFNTIIVELHKYLYVLLIIIAATGQRRSGLILVRPFLFMNLYKSAKT